VFEPTHDQCREGEGEEEDAQPPYTFVGYGEEGFDFVIEDVFGSGRASMVAVGATAGGCWLCCGQGL